MSYQDTFQIAQAPYFIPTTIPQTSSLHYALLYATPVQRQEALLLNAFFIKMHNILNHSTEPQVAKLKFNWWLEEIRRCYEGQPQHPLSIALMPLIQDHKISQTHFQKFLQGLISDLEPPFYSSMQDVVAYCQTIGGSKCVIFCTLFNPTEAATREFALNLGITFQVIHLIRQFGRYCRKKILYVPSELLSTLSLTRAQLLARNCTNADLFALLQPYSAAALHFYAKALAALPQRDRKSQRCLLILANIYLGLLAELEYEKFAVLDQQLSLTPVRKLWIAWQTQFREKYRIFHG